MFTLFISVMLGLSIIGCGSDINGGEKVTVVRDTIKCDAPDVCTGNKMTCTRGGYYANEWDCTVFIKE